jgi:hypothetical protein
MRRLFLSALLALSLSGFERAQEMTGKIAEDTRQEILDLESAGRIWSKALLRPRIGRSTLTPMALP